MGEKRAQDQPVELFYLYKDKIKYCTIYYILGEKLLGTQHYIFQSIHIR